jgi:hypothetical protein
MIRALITAFLCALAVIAGDLFFRGSLLSYVRPIILTPREQAVTNAPVEVRWDGPKEMQVILTPVGDAPRDLGVQTSPFEIGRGDFLRDGGYKLELQALRFGSWIRTERLFQVYAAPPPTSDEQDDGDVTENRFFLDALDAVRRVRDQARGRAKQYRLENSVLRDETARLSEQIEALQRLQDDDLEHAEDLEARLLQLAGQLRALSEENMALRMRLESVIPCTVWGYYSYPRPNTIPATRQIIAVTDNQARIFRNQLECEALRRDDPTASSTCFCVGNSWGR